MTGKLIFKDDSEFSGISFGASKSIAGEVVFATGMTGYPEAFTDPSFAGQILILTYPIIGSYGIPDKKFWESDGIKISGLVVSQYIDTPSHFQSKKTLANWLKEFDIPALEIKDTRFLAQKLRDNGAMLGKIVIGKDVKYYDPDINNLVAQVSTKKIIKEFPLASRGETSQSKIVLLYDCGAKGNIARCLVKRGVRVLTVPWDFDPYDTSVIARIRRQPETWQSTQEDRHAKSDLARDDKSWFDAVVISNGPGNPKRADKTIEIIKTFLEKGVPILGVCLGNQLLALAAGGDTSKMKFGHRSQNQPSMLVGSKRCFITTQNHGYHVSKIPQDFKPWFINANDNTNEGIIHKSLPIMSVQFHPEATPGPLDTEWIFDYFLERVSMSF